MPPNRSGAGALRAAARAAARGAAALPPPSTLATSSTSESGFQSAKPSAHRYVSCVICPAKTPRDVNCRFFNTPQQAELAGFRPCLRCRPELAPGSAPVDDAGRIAQLIVQRLEEGALDGNAGLEDIADQFELSSRQIRRIVQQELGVPPIQLLLTRRLTPTR